MAYSDFTLVRVRQELNITLDESQNLFAAVEPVAPSALLSEFLAAYLSLATAINSEKARSEFIIAPVLADVKQHTHSKLSLFSGKEFDVDRDRGLVGRCDFLLSQSSEQLVITAPVVAIVEAKKEDLINGLGQCIAEMVAAQIFNHQAGNLIPRIYGAVTSGTNWRFVILEEQTAFIDWVEYYIDRVDKILGILLQAQEKAIGE